MSAPVPEKLYTSLSRMASFDAAEVAAKVVVSVVAALALPPSRLAAVARRCQSRSPHSPSRRRTLPHSPPPRRSLLPALRYWKLPPHRHRERTPGHRHAARAQRTRAPPAAFPAAPPCRRVGIVCPVSVSVPAPVLIKPPWALGSEA